MRIEFVLPTILCLLALLPVSAQGEGNQPRNQAASQKAEPPANVADEQNQQRFWRVNLPDGSGYSVALDRVCSLSMQRYVLDGAFYVSEFTVDTVGRALARFYYIEPIAESAGSKGVARVVERGRELLDRAGSRAGVDAHHMVQKSYPTTTHSGMLEFRVLEADELEAIYASAQRAWQSGKGRTVTVKVK